MQLSYPTHYPVSCVVSWLSIFFLFITSKPIIYWSFLPPYWRLSLIVQNCSRIIILIFHQNIIRIHGKQLFIFVVWWNHWHHFTIKVITIVYESTSHYDKAILIYTMHLITCMYSGNNSQHMSYRYIFHINLLANSSSRSVGKTSY